MVKEIDVTNDTEIVRDYTDAELAYKNNMIKEAEKLKKAELAKEAARKVLLDKLGLTEDEAKLLLG